LGLLDHVVGASFGNSVTIVAHVRRSAAPAAREHRGDIAVGLPQLLAGSDRLTLMSHLAAQASESAALAVLPFRSPHLRRRDGVASRVEWHPTNVHLRFLQLLRAEARKVAGVYS
jgi:hypothetical protein